MMHPQDEGSSFDGVASEPVTPPAEAPPLAPPMQPPMQQLFEPLVQPIVQLPSQPPAQLPAQLPVSGSPVAELRSSADLGSVEQPGMTTAENVAEAVFDLPARAPRYQVSGESSTVQALPAEHVSRDVSASHPALPALQVSGSEPPAGHLAYSTLSSLLVVFVLILTIRFTVPPLVESLRYSWHHGQLRAEYELAGQKLQNVSLKSLSEASELVSSRVGPSVVHINMLEVYATRPIFGSKSERVEMVGQGSGVILDREGHILTNQHVLDDEVLSEKSGRIEVLLSDGRRLMAEQIGIDAATDLAVIKVRADGLMPAAWGDSDRVDVGTPVWAVGSPFGLERTVTFGIISGKHRMNLRGTRWDLSGDPKGFDRSQSTIYRDLMQTDVAVNPGNSGGPLINSQGEIVGINTAIIDEHYIGISFAIPSNVARRVAEHLIRDGEVARGWLGVALADPIAVVDESTGNLSPSQGALVSEVVSSADSPARVAGILPGDLIVKFGDYPIPNYRTLVSRVAQTDVGSTVPVEVIRHGESLILKVEISRRKKVIE